MSEQTESYQLFTEYDFHATLRVFQRGKLKELTEDYVLTAQNHRPVLINRKAVSYADVIKEPGANQ